MSTPELIAWSLALVFGLIGSAIMSGLETGYYRVDRLAAAAAAAKPNAGFADRTLDTLLRSPQSTLASLLIGNNAANYIGALGVTAILTGAGLNDQSVLVVNTLVLTPLLLVFGETLPKEIMRTAADNIMRRAAFGLSLLVRVCTVTGLAPMLTLFASGVGRLLRAPADPALTRREQVRSLLAGDSDTVALSESQRNLIDAIFRLEHTGVRDRMRPIAQIPIVRADDPKAVLDAAMGAELLLLTSASGEPIAFIGALEAITSSGAPPLQGLAPLRTVDIEADLLAAAESLAGLGAEPALVIGPGGPAGAIGIGEILRALPVPEPKRKAPGRL